MEDLTGEVKDPSDDEEGSKSEEGEEKGEKAENNSCISIYFQSKKHDLKVKLYLFLIHNLDCGRLASA